MGVSYSTDIVTGFVLTEEDLSNLRDWWVVDHPDVEDPDDYGTYEWLEDFVRPFPELSYSDCGSMPYGGDGEYAIGITRLGRHIYYRDEYTEWIDMNADTPNAGERLAIQNASALLGRTEPAEIKRLVGMSIS